MITPFRTAIIPFLQAAIGTSTRGIIDVGTVDVGCWNVGMLECWNVVTDVGCCNWMLWYYQ